MKMDDTELEEKLKRQVEEWSTNSNDCMTIQLIRGDGTVSASFKPEFTYPIFGDEEAIFGYQGLEIVLSFASHNMRPHIQISYERKFEAQGEVRATDIHEQLREFLPECAFSNQDVVEALKDPWGSGRPPPGIRVNAYAGPGRGEYMTYMADVADPEARDILENMQILIPMFIEGGTALQLEQDWTTKRWKIFLTYFVQHESEIPPDAGPEYSRYSLVGFGTSYRVFAFPDREVPTRFDRINDDCLLDWLPHPETGLLPTTITNPTDTDNPLKLPSRERLSQFLILPPYHRQSNGQELYNMMYQRLTKDINVREFTVEDPNEAFDELRDLCDFIALRNFNDEFASLQINADIPADRLRSNSDIPTDLIVPIALREKLRTQTKIMPRQFDRLVEMQTLSKIPPLKRSRNRITRKEKATNAHDKAYYLWRLYVKQRLYIFNRDQLAQVEHQERVEKLESALDSVIEAYEKTIEKVEKKEKRGELFSRPNANEEFRTFPRIETNGDEAVEGAAPRKRNRKVIEDDEDESMEEASEADGVNGHKKARVED